MSAGGDGSGGGLGGVQGGRNTPPHGSPTPMDKATLKVHLPNGNCIFLSVYLNLMHRAVIPSSAFVYTVEHISMREATPVRSQRHYRRFDTDVGVVCRVAFDVSG